MIGNYDNQENMTQTLIFMHSAAPHHSFEVSRRRMPGRGTEAYPLDWTR